MEGNVFAPLADRMRPNKLEDFIGQTHIVYPKSFLVRAIESDYSRSKNDTKIRRKENFFSS